MSAKFGVAGNPQSFYDEGFKASVQIPGYLEKLGLDAYEYQCGKGVNVKEETARAIGAKAKEHGIAMSLHSPYYINPANPDPKAVGKNIGYIVQSLELARLMGAVRITIHAGSVMKMSREEALKNAKAFFRLALSETEGFSEIALCPETMGRINQLGNFEEVMEICTLSERLIPTIDFGHLNARTHGGLKGKDDFLALLNEMENRLGEERLKRFHSHFSRIEYSAGGEKRHLTFEDTEYGPDFGPLAEALVQKGAEPTIICESAGTQAMDALTMKSIYISLQK